MSVYILVSDYYHGTYGTSMISVVFATPLAAQKYAAEHGFTYPKWEVKEYEVNN